MRPEYLLLGGLFCLVPEASIAGPPFVTDDPAPTDRGHWEIYQFASATRELGSTSADMGFDLNYGAASDVQLTATLPVHAEPDTPLDISDVELAVKYRFAHQQAGQASADMAFFPRVYLPTGRGSRHAQILLPIWAGREWGKWSLFGGGGYMIHPGAGQRDFWQQGLAISRRIRPGFQIGAEYFGRGRSSEDDRPLHGLNLAATIHISGPLSWAISAGQALNRQQTIAYTALKLDL